MLKYFGLVFRSWGRTNLVNTNQASGYDVDASACLLWGSPSFSQSKDVRLYVGNSLGDDVSVIEMPSLKVIGDMTVSEHVHGVAVQGDGRKLFTTSATDHTLIISDTATDKIIATVKLPGKPNQCAVTPDGRYVVVAIHAIISSGISGRS
jgi:YVTN family beta-propeller protein